MTSWTSLKDVDDRAGQPNEPQQYHNNICSLGEVNIQILLYYRSGYTLEDKLRSLYLI